MNKTPGRRIKRSLLASVAMIAAVFAGMAATAASATAALPQDEYVAILPVNNQARDMALGGANAPVVSRDSSSISYAETWRVVYSSTYPGEVYLANRSNLNGDMYLKGGGAAGSAATGSTFQTPQGSAYRWKMVGDRSNLKLVNVATGRILTYHAPGTQDPNLPTFTMEPDFKADQRYNVKHLSKA